MSQPKLIPVAPAGLYERLKRLPFAGQLVCSHSALEAGAIEEILLDYEVGSGGIADGATFKLTFKFYSDWAPFQTHDPQGANYLTAEYVAGPLADGQSAATVQHLAVRFEQKGHERPFQKAIIIDIIDGYLNAGDRILIRLGDRRFGGPGTRVQTFIEDDFRFRAYVDPLGTSRFVAVPGDVSLRIFAGPPAHVALNGPRFARPGAEAPFHVALHDRWGNAVSDAGGAIALTAQADDATVLASDIPLPAQGWAAARFDVPTDRDLRVSAAFPGLSAANADLTIIPDAPAPRGFYGDLHVHAHDTVGTNSPAYNAAYARDIAGVDVFGYTANDFQITDANWQAGVAAVNAINAPGSFVAYPVQEWCGSSTAGGDHKVIFLGDEPPGFPYDAEGNHNRTLVWNEDMRGTAATLGRWPIEELWDAYAAKLESHLIIPHVGGRRYIADWHHPELERLVEIVSAWGHFPWLYQEVIARGYQLGVTANGDEHRGRPGGGAPGVNVFGVRGGLTGILAERLDRATIGAALRARHTFATTGERTALLVHSGAYIQGDAFMSDGPATISYRFLGDEGFEEIAAFDHTGVLWRRNLHQELGFSQNRLRLRWGGARIKDRYRWAVWNGTLRLDGAALGRFSASGFEHNEETAWRIGADAIGFHSETYGDADAIELEIDDLANARFVVEGTIGAFAKSANAPPHKPRDYAPDFRWEVSGAELIAQGELRRELGGVGLFLAFERVTEAELPRDLSGSFTLAPQNAPFGFRPVYLYGRQRDDSKVWSSAQFITFTAGA
ncbi:hypothetical protein CWB41_12025 [Methylovirgula ligni]|uniref:DUF3604 domain-containing protein n=1 Tax=Methylovirgula ligni TaxID=569860 RepID=UPI0010C3E313|nr:DUF3604 domain-containing protein [Methylovirgula ligni]QAY96366.1 hypothetical protein CWB41_12025 [Methylovirgula ligni]